MIKNLLTLLVLMASTYAFGQWRPNTMHAEKIATDLKEYGFKGKVKSVTAIYYNDLVIKDGKWLEDEDKVTRGEKKIFNEDGNIAEVHESYLSEEDFEEKTISIVQFKDGLKSSYKKMNSDGQQLEEGVYVWHNSRNYKLTIAKSNGIQVNSFYKLNEKFRDYRGGYEYRKNGSVILAESYYSTLNSRGELVKTRFSDYISGLKYSLVLKNIEKDARGNLIKAALVDEETGEFKYLFVRKFEYY